MSKQIFFCGAMLNHEGLKKYRGEGPAASNWIKGFFTGLIENDIEVKCFSPIWDSLFPKGRLMPGKKQYLDHLVEHVLIRYFNLPGLRTKSVAYSLEKAIKKAIKNGDKPIAILNYNTYPYYCIALKKVAKKYPNIPWINVVLDLDDPEKDNWGAFLNDSKGSSASVFLSWWGFKNAPIERKHHMDAGWNGTLPQLHTSKEKVFLYAGKYTKSGGVDDIIEAIKLFPDKDAIFQFYGKDVYEPLVNLAKEDSRVKIMGFVTDDELDAACMRATAFLSPREFNYQGTKMIFPSKILFYLKFQKPVVSAILPGLSPEYHNILLAPTDNTPTAWVEAMNKAITLDKIALDELAEKTSVLLQKKKWSNQALSLIQFIESIK